MGARAKLCGDGVKKSWVGFLIFLQNPVWMLELAHLNGNAQTVGLISVLLHEGEIGSGQRAHTNQFYFVVGNSRQGQTLCGGQDLSARHGGEV